MSNHKQSLTANGIENYKQHLLLIFIKPLAITMELSTRSSAKATLAITTQMKIMKKLFKIETMLVYEARQFVHINN